MAKAFYSTGYVTRAGKGERIAQKNKNREKKVILLPSLKAHIIMLYLRHQIIDEISGLLEPFLIYIP